MLEGDNMNNAFEIIWSVGSEGAFDLSDDCLYLWIEQDHTLSHRVDGVAT